MDLEQTEAECAAVAGPRVSLAAMEAKIDAVHHFLASEAVEAMGQPVTDSMRLLSICIVVMQNGFSIIGKSAPASASRFDANLGRKLAYEDAIRQLWPLEGYALRERLYDEEQNGTE